MSLLKVCALSVAAIERRLAQPSASLAAPSVPQVYRASNAGVALFSSHFSLGGFLPEGSLAKDVLFRRKPVPVLHVLPSLYSSSESCPQRERSPASPLFLSVGVKIKRGRFKIKESEKIVSLAKGEELRA